MFNKFCLDICPYGKEELYPDKEFCKILDHIEDAEECPVVLYSDYLSSKLKRKD